jgi:hypothetical protein
LFIQQTALIESRTTTTKQCSSLIHGILGRYPLTDEISTLVASWSADIDLAKIVVAAGALQFLAILNQFREIEDAFCSLARSATEAQLAKDAAKRSVLVRIAAVMSLGASPDPREELADIAKLLRMTIPYTVASIFMGAHNTDWNSTETDKFLTAMSVRRNELATRGDRWPVILEALGLYRSRLQQPAIDLQRAVLSEANVIGATCSGIAGTKDFDCDFDCVIVDEAGRTTPLDLLMPIVRGMSIVLVGDHKQLPPFIGDSLKEELNDIERKLIERSIFESIYESSHGGRRQALRKQYRMAPAICDVVREISYKDDPSLALETAGAALNRKHNVPGLGAIHWSLPVGPKNNAESLNGKHGLVNQAEVDAIVDMFERIAANQSKRSKDQYSIGIISMYKQQSHAIERRLGKLRQDYPSIVVEIGTVDSFQGREKDSIILSFSETNPNRRRFFYDRRRLNVALSRAKELLVIIGSLDKLGARRSAFGVDNPLFELRFLIESGIGVCSSKEIFNA